MIKNVKEQVSRRINSEANTFLRSLRIEKEENSKEVIFRVKT